MIPEASYKSCTSGTPSPQKCREPKSCSVQSRFVLEQLGKLGISTSMHSMYTELQALVSAMPCTVFWKITCSNVAVYRKIVTNCFRCCEFHCLLIHSFTLGRKSFKDFQCFYDATRGTPGKKHSAVSSARPAFCRLWMLQFFQVPRCLCV